MVKIFLDHISKEFGNNLVVDDLSLEINEKEFFILLGPSGCGKSTTLNIIAGLEKATHGNVYFDDEIVDNLPPEKRDIAMVFQSYALYPHMNAYDNIAFTLKLKKTPKDEIKKRIEEVGELIGISDLLYRRPYELSGGERQRVALARAIVRRPKVFLLDEPMSNLDAKLRVAMRGELIRLQKILKTTTVYVTHDQVEAMTMGERIGVLSNKGKLMQVDPPLKIFGQPQNIFVAGFIGSPPMNLFESSLLKDKNGRKAIFESSDFSIEIPPSLMHAIQSQSDASEFIIGARPKYIVVSKTPVKNGIECEIYTIEPLGTETIIDLKRGNEIIRTMTEGTFKSRIGNKVWISFDPNRLHVFDKKTERLLI